MITGRIEGLGRLQANLTAVASTYDREQERIHKGLGADLVEAARARARVRTGAMRASIRPVSTSDRLEVTAGQRLTYVAFQHWGTRFVSPNRFLIDPLHERERRMVDEYQEQTNRFLQRIF